MITLQFHSKPTDIKLYILPSHMIWPISTPLILEVICLYGNGSMKKQLHIPILFNPKRELGIIPKVMLNRNKDLNNYIYLNFRKK
jgi:hypothetical protein